MMRSSPSRPPLQKAPFSSVIWGMGHGMSLRPPPGGEVEVETELKSYQYHERSRKPTSLWSPGGGSRRTRARSAPLGRRGGRGLEFFEPSVDAVGEHLDVRARVVVADDAEDEPAVVGGDGDVDAHRGLQGDPREHLEQLAVQREHRLLRTGDVGGDGLVDGVATPGARGRSERTGRAGGSAAAAAACAPAS